MTAATIHRPSRPQLPNQRPTQLPTQLPTQRSGRPSLHVVPPVAAPAAHAVPPVRPGPTGAVQLTRRGRLVLLVLLVAAGTALMMALAGLVGGAAAGTAPHRPATRTIVVQPGQTLWSIAGTVAPNVDRRDTIATIVELNALPSTAVSAGARIAVPAG